MVVDAEEAAVEAVEEEVDAEEEDHGGARNDQDHPMVVIARPRRIKTNDFYRFL